MSDLAILCELLQEFPNELKDPLTKDIKILYDKFYAMLDYDEQERITKCEKIFRDEQEEEIKREREELIRSLQLELNDTEHKIKTYTSRLFINNRLNKETLEELEVTYKILLSQLEELELTNK